LKFIVTKQDRLDKILYKELNVARNQAENLIKKHGIRVDGKLVKKCGFKVKEGQVIEFELIESKQSSGVKIDFDVDIIYEDKNLLIINKPPFLVVHPAPSVKEPTLVDWLKNRGVSLSTISGEERHGIVHRIDKETSGALVVAKNNDSHKELSSQLENRSMGRYYLAIIDNPLKEDLIVDKPIFRDRKNRIKMAIDQNGRESKSAFIKLALSKNGKFELIACKLFSGRTHQIRVHLSSISRHIVGDKLYGYKSKKDTIPRVMLHAYIIYLKDPKDDKYIIKKAPLFEDFKDILYKEFDKEEIDEKINSDYIISRFDKFV